MVDGGISLRITSGKKKKKKIKPCHIIIALNLRVLNDILTIDSFGIFKS